MNKQNRNWRQNTLAALIITLGVTGALELPAAASHSSLKLAQVGVRSQLDLPTPLNLRPRTHIPLPTNSRSRDYHNYPRYRDYDRHYKYDYDRRTHRRRDREGDTIIIINPAESYSNYNRHIRIIRQ